MNLAYDGVAVSEMGNVSSSLVRGNTVVLSYAVDVNFSELAIVFFRADGTSSEDKIDVPPLGETREVIADIDPADCLRAVGIVGWLEGVPYRLKAGPEAHLDRIFNPSLLSINRNIRWDGRISDFETRYFACLNSIAANRGNFALVHYCVVSAGYTAIELGDLRKVRNLAAAAAPSVAQVSDVTGHEIIMSYAMYNLHIAIATSNRKLLEDIGQMALDRLDRLDEDPIATFNAVRVIVLMATYYLQRQDFVRAKLFASQAEKIMRIAGTGYPLFPNNIPELGTIFDIGFHGVSIRLKLEGQEIPEYLSVGRYETSPSNVWKKATRLRQGESIARLNEQFGKMCRPPLAASTTPAEAATPRKWVVDRTAPDAMSRLLHARAHKCVQRGALDDAERASRAAIAQNPRAPGIGWLLCRILTNKGRFADGEAVAKDEIERYPKLTHVKLYLVENLEAQNRLAEAAALVREIVAEKPDLAGAQAAWKRLIGSVDA